MPKILLVTIFLLFIWAFFIEPHLLVVKHYQIDSLKGIRIVFASDFHISKFDGGRLNRVVKLINEQNPDIVIFGGDFIKGHDGKNTLSICLLYTSKYFIKYLSYTSKYLLSVSKKQKLHNKFKKDLFKLRHKHLKYIQ